MSHRLYIACKENVSWSWGVAVEPLQINDIMMNGHINCGKLVRFVVWTLPSLAERGLARLGSYNIRNLVFFV